MSALTKTAARYDFLDADPDHVVFAHSIDVEDQEAKVLRTILLDKLTWEWMGEPREITVTVEPGDTLNERL